jgi:hypothetical protein
MANLKSTDKLKLEKLFEMGGGYVLDFTNAKFQEFIHSVSGKDIYNDKYATYGDSKGKRFREFWQQENDQTVGKVIAEMIEHWKTSKLLANKDITKSDELLVAECEKIANRLAGVSTQKETPKTEHTEEEFLKQEFEEIKLNNLGLESGLVTVLEQRIKEIQKGIRSKASLSVLFLCGSSLEGVLLGIASKNPALFNKALACPKDNNTGKPKGFSDWTLNDLINVSHEVGFIGLDVKKFGHALRDFRNYIHPYAQWSSKFDPDGHTAEICWQVFKAAIHDINKKLKE